MQRGMCCDCAGLILGVARAVGVTDRGLPTYGPQTAPERLLDALSGDLEPVADNSRGVLSDSAWEFFLPGDVLVLMVAAPWGRPHPRHLAYWTGTSLLHAEGNHGVIETELTNPWRRRLHSVWRWRGLRDE